MTDSISLSSFSGSKLAGWDSAPDSNTKKTDKKRHKCKFAGCDQTFAHYSSRLKHYHRLHDDNVLPKTNNMNQDPSSSDDLRQKDSSHSEVSATVNTVGKLQPHVKEVYNLCHSYFNSENCTDDAIEKIKGSKIVQNYAKEIRDTAATIQDSKRIEADELLTLVRIKSQNLREQMFLANATEMHDIMDTILKLCIESDKHSFEYLSSFYGVLGAALQYSKKYSEKINDESKRAALLKNALCEIIEEQGKNPQAQDSLNPSNKRIRL